MSKLGRFSRTELLLGEVGMEKLANSTVAIFGVGGTGGVIGGYLANAGNDVTFLARGAHLAAMQKDGLTIHTNHRGDINRQIHATSKTVGKKKTETMKERILDINPKAVVDTIEDFYLPEQAERFFTMPYDYVIDAIDTVTGKIDLVLQCRDRHIPIICSMGAGNKLQMIGMICSMGAGNKLDPTKFEVTDIYKTSVDPLARVMRKKLKENRVKKLKVVYSKEKPLRVRQSGCGKNCICPPGSISFVPSVVGLIIAGEVVRDLTGAKVEVSA